MSHDTHDATWSAPGPGPWMQDRAHLPVAVTPLLQEAYPSGFSKGFREAFEPWGVLLDTLRLEYVNGFPYVQPQPFDAPGADGPKSHEYIGAEIEAPMGDDLTIIGIGGSEGVYEGPARIVRNFDDLIDLQEGDVLVTTATGESFNAFLALVGAVVTDYGSFISHAAIMAREMGFPTVVATIDATTRIGNGMLVRVDGSAGTVIIVGA